MEMASAPSCLKIAVSYSTHHAPPFHKSSLNNNKKHRTHIQLPLRSPKQVDNTAKILTQPINIKAKPTTNDNNNSSSCRDKIKHVNGNTKNTTSDVLRLMDSLSLPIPLDIYSSLIKECTFTRDSCGALELHAHINNSGLRPTLPFLNRLLLLHASCGHLHIARHLFDKMTPKDFYSWAIIILAYLDVGDYQEATILFAHMLQHQKGTLQFPAWIVVFILKACVLTMNMGLGKQVHTLLLKLGTSSDLSLSGSLISFYGKFRCLEEANFVFDQLCRHNTVVWTAKIVNDCREGNLHEVIHDFKEMGRSGIKKNAFTFSSVLKACARIDDGGICGQQVHANAIKFGLESEAFVQCGLVDMYGKCGLLRDSKRVFEATTDVERNPACWNAMLMGYVQNRFSVEAIKCLYRMKAAGIEVPESLLNDVRIACGTIYLEK